MPESEEYTVGWICALSTEYVAARAFLDEIHDNPKYRAPGDDNDYTLGAIKGHNVVMAVMPEGEYGMASAAGVAKDMCRTFTNLKIHLVVGIGKGAPSPECDIRLGDVVVSSPRGNIGGVVQYDFGKTIQDRAFQMTGFLKQPPRVLRTAVNGLKTEYETDGHCLEAAIEAVLMKKPRLQKKYGRPHPNTDILYRSGYEHREDELPCLQVCGNDPQNVVLRAERDVDDVVVVHHGLIASANQLIQSAVVRDELAKKLGVICFETEAAGLMNSLNCLVIRGICDYSDTHQNTLWQGYAAMTAAAYAKDLLCRISPIRVDADIQFLDAVAKTNDQLTELKSQLSSSDTAMQTALQNTQMAISSESAHLLHEIQSQVDIRGSHFDAQLGEIRMMLTESDERKELLSTMTGSALAQSAQRIQQQIAALDERMSRRLTHVAQLVDSLVLVGQVLSETGASRTICDEWESMSQLAGSPSPLRGLNKDLTCTERAISGCHCKPGRRRKLREKIRSCFLVQRVFHVRTSRD